MRTIAALSILTLAPALGAADKLTWQDRVEIDRGLDFEYAKVKVLLPRSRKPLEFNADGTWDKAAWAAIAKQEGPAARQGDSVPITKVIIEPDRLVFDINGGYNGGRHWYSNGQIGGGPSSNPTMTPIAQGDSDAKSAVSESMSRLRYCCPWRCPCPPSRGCPDTAPDRRPGSPCAPGGPRGSLGVLEASCAGPLPS